ncbi:hypothetical protein BC567DRAFT_207555 [Phyllosticta citribraziliensis]
MERLEDPFRAKTAAPLPRRESSFAFRWAQCARYEGRTGEEEEEEEEDWEGPEKADNETNHNSRSFIIERRQWPWDLFKPRRKEVRSAMPVRCRLPSPALPGPPLDERFASDPLLEGGPARGPAALAGLEPEHWNRWEMSANKDLQKNRGVVDAFVKKVGRGLLMQQGLRAGKRKREENTPRADSPGSKTSSEVKSKKKYEGQEKRVAVRR